MYSQPLFIIGAGRSGTNILRDALTTLPGITTWPCDEINLIFRHGNRSHPNDEFTRAMAGEKVKQYIRKQVDKLARQSPGNMVVEKTCANSLRVPFLDEIFPNARFIFITRNGYDVTASAMKRWKAPVEPGYLWKKFQFVPYSDIPYYGFQFMKNRIQQALSKEKKLSQWGPVYEGMPEDVQKLSLAEVCAKQWARCVSKASQDLHSLDTERVYKLTYETFSRNPQEQIAQILAWLQMKDIDQATIQKAVTNVKQSSVGKGVQELTSDQLARIEPIINPVMERYHDPVAKVH